MATRDERRSIQSLMRFPGLVSDMQSHRRRTSIVFIALLLVQVLSPMAFVQAEQSSTTPRPTLNSKCCSRLNVSPSLAAEHGWVEPRRNEPARRTCSIATSQLVETSEWTEETVNRSWTVFTSSAIPIPSPASGTTTCSRRHQLFLLPPPASFHCDVNSKTPPPWRNSTSLGLAAMDATDKVQTDLLRGLLGLDMIAPNPFVNQEGAVVNIVLSGDELPSGLNQRSDVVLDTHSGRFATMAIDTGQIGLVGSARDSNGWSRVRFTKS